MNIADLLKRKLLTASLAAGLVLTGCTAKEPTFDWVSDKDDIVLGVTALKDLTVALGSKRIYVLGGTRKVTVTVDGKPRRINLRGGLCFDHDRGLANFYIYGFMKRWGATYPEVYDDRVEQAAEAQVDIIKRDKVSIPEE